jgi:HEAT repeat protein
MLLMGLAGLLAAPPAQGRTDRIARLIRILESSSSYKVRLKVVIALGKLGDRRAVPALVRRLKDESRAVRGVSAAVLGRLGDRRAIPALERAARSDPHRFVRDRARAAAKQLSRTASSPGSNGRILVVLGRPVDRSRRAGKAGVAAFEKGLARAFATTPGVSTARAGQAPSPAALRQRRMKGFQLDGVIVRLKSRQSGRNLEVTGAVKVTLSTYPGDSIKAVYSGETTIAAEGSGKSLERSLLRDLFDAAAKEARRQITASYLARQ